VCLLLFFCGRQDDWLKWHLTDSRAACLNAVRKIKDVNSTMYRAAQSGCAKKSLSRGKKVQFSGKARCAAKMIEIECL